MTPSSHRLLLVALLALVSCRSAPPRSPGPCDRKEGSVLDVCLRGAEATEVKALTAERRGKARPPGPEGDAARDQRDLDLKAALAQCEALSGDAKARCVVSAELDHGP